MPLQRHPETGTAYRRARESLLQFVQTYDTPTMLDPILLSCKPFFVIGCDNHRTHTFVLHSALISDPGVEIAHLPIEPRDPFCPPGDGDDLKSLFAEPVDRLLGCSARADHEYPVRHRDRLLLDRHQAPHPLEALAEHSPRPCPCLSLIGRNPHAPLSHVDHGQEVRIDPHLAQELSERGLKQFGRAPENENGGAGFTLEKGLHRGLVRLPAEAGDNGDLLDIFLLSKHLSEFLVVEGPRQGVFAVT